MKILLVLLGGGVGALCRYGISLFAARTYGTGFAWGTLIVNLVGCLLIGFFFAFADQRGVMSPSTRLFLVTGFLGAMTTFSTYMLETANFTRNGIPVMGLVNFAANNIGGLLLVLGGMWLGNRV